MPTQSVVFLIIFTLAFAGVIIAVMKLPATARFQEQINDAVVKAYERQRNTLEGRELAAVVGVKAGALSAVEADEATGRMQRMTGNQVAAHRRNVRREISMRRARIDKKVARHALRWGR